MATIDYKEKYMQALERARQFSEKSYLGDSAGIVEYIFPELRESEDERIRKELIAMVRLSCTNGDDVDKKIAWLEKQGDEKASCINPCPVKLVEQKPIDKIEPKPVEWSLPYGKNETADKLVALAECLEMGGDCLFNGLSGNDYGKFLRVLAIELTEVKHAWSEWSEEDKKVTKWVIDYIGNCPNESFDFYGGVGKEAVLSWLNKLKDILQLQAKQEWSEEDQEMLNQVIEDIVKLAGPYVCYHKDVDWLKSLKDRVQPKPRQEWSEKDENHVKSILSTIECCKARFQNSQAMVEAYNADIEWLKSLRPQSQWKPSEEQIYWLKWATGRMPYTEKANEAEAVLEELLADLKKLTEE